MTKRKRTKEQTMFYKHRVTQISLKTKNELRCSGRVSSSCSTSETRCVNPVTNPVISHEGERTEKCYDKWNISMVICDTDIP